MNHKTTRVPPSCFHKLAFPLFVPAARRDGLVVLHWRASRKNDAPMLRTASNPWSWW